MWQPDRPVGWPTWLAAVAFVLASAGSHAAAAAGAAAAAAAASPVTGPTGVDGARIELLVAPSFFHGVHGMAVAANGDVYAGDILGQTLWRIPRGSRTPEVFVGPPRGMADDVAIRADGLVTWTDILPGIVYARRPGGKPYVIASGLTGANTVVFGPDGRLYLSQLFGVDRLFELDPDGAVPPRLLLEQDGGLNGCQITADNVLYAPQGTLHRVVRMRLPDLTPEVLADGLVWPTGVKLDSKGHIFGVDLTAGTVFQVDPVAHSTRRVAQLLPSIDNLAIDHEDRLLVSSPGDNTIYRIEPASGSVEAWIPGRLSVPGGVAIDGHGRVLVADTFGFKAVNGRTGAITELGRRVGAPEIVSGMNVRRCGDKVTLTHWYDGVVRILDADGTHVERVVRSLKKPQDAIVLDDGRTLIAEPGARRIAVVQPGRETPEDWINGVNAAGLTCATERGELYYTDPTAGTLMRVSIATRETTVIARGLSDPEGVELGRGATLYVVEASAGRVLSIDPASGRTQRIVEGLPPSLDPSPGIERPWVLGGIATDRAGTLYVSASRNAALYRIRLPAHRDPIRAAP